MGICVSISIRVSILIFSRRILFFKYTAIKFASAQIRALTLTEITGVSIFTSDIYFRTLKKVFVCSFSIASCTSERIHRNSSFIRIKKRKIVHHKRASRPCKNQSFIFSSETFFETTIPRTLHGNIAPTKSTNTFQRYFHSYFDRIILQKRKISLLFNLFASTTKK